jgi:hypothetical protein
MSKFTATTKGNPCPSCGDITGNCRHQAEGEIILCMTANSNRRGDIVDGGYKVIDISQDGLWAILKPNDEQWSEEQKQQWASEQRQRRENSRREREQKLAGLLPIPERDKHYRHIISTLGLNQKHRVSDLSEHRGLNSEEIDFAVGQGWLCSWQPGREFKEASVNLAGINPSGVRRSLLGVTGIGITAIDNEGKVTGFQIASDNREKFGKYLWLSSASRHGNSPHLPSGELPIFVWKHPEATEVTETWLVEGCLKSLITALKLWFRCDRKDIQVIGAAGANFNGSINAVSEALQGNVVLIPDAGSVSNSGIFKNYKSAIEELASQAYSVSVAWWGQLEKGKDQDIDELDNTLAFDLISPGEFFSLQEDTEKAEANEWAWKNWIKSRKFTPDITVNQQRFCYPKLPEKDTIIAVKSGLGSNKTGATIDQIRLSPNRVFWFASLNVLLLQTGSRAKENGVSLYHYQTEDGALFLKDSDTGISLCVDSISHLDGYFSGADIVIDEAVSVLQGICDGGTLKDNQAKAIALFTKMCRECNRIFLLDGNLADIHVDFIAKISGKKSFKILNEAKIPPHKIKIVDGIDANGEIAKRDKSPLEKMMLAEGVIPWIASDSRKLTEKLKEMFNQAGKQGYTLNKNSSGEKWAKDFLTSPDSFIAQNKPSNFIVSPVATSGLSIQSRNHFTEKITFFVGVLGTNSQHQKMFRLRDDSIIHYVFCPERSMVERRDKPSTYSVKKYAQILEDKAIQSAILAADGNTSAMLEIVGKAIARSNDDWWAFSCQLGVLDNFEMNNLRKCLIHVLEEAGHDVEVVQWDTDKEISELEKQADEAVTNRHASEMYQAIEFSDINEANKVSRGNPNEATQLRIEKTRLLDRLPGIKDTKIHEMSTDSLSAFWLALESINHFAGMMFLYTKETPVWTQEFIANYHLKDKQYIAQNQRFYLLNNFEISKKRSEVAWYYRATNQHFFLGQAKSDSHQPAWALQELNIMQFLEGEYHKDSPQVTELISKLRGRDDICRALNLTLKPPTEDGKENIATVAGLLGRIGLKFGKAKQKLINGVKTRHYSIDNDVLNCPVRLAVLDAIARKFDDYLESETVAKIDWDNLPEIELVEPSPDDEWLTDENIAILVKDLEDCDIEMLADLRKFTPVAALKKAAATLAADVRSRIARWVSELNHQNFGVAV